MRGSRSRSRNHAATWPRLGGEAAFAKGGAFFTRRGGSWGTSFLGLRTPPQPEAVAAESALDLPRLLAALVAELPPARAARVAAAVTGLSRDAIYAQVLALKSAPR